MEQQKSLGDFQVFVLNSEVNSELSEHAHFACSDTQLRQAFLFQGPQSSADEGQAGSSQNGSAHLPGERILKQNYPPPPAAAIALPLLVSPCGHLWLPGLLTSARAIPGVCTPECSLRLF